MYHKDMLKITKIQCKNGQKKCSLVMQQAWKFMLFRETIYHYCDLNLAETMKQSFVSLELYLQEMIQEVTIQK